MAQWEALRKQARQLEFELDGRLANFSKLAATHSHSHSHSQQSDSGSGSGSGSGAGAGAGAGTFVVAQAAELELDDLLKQLAGTINAMATHLDGAESASGAGVNTASMAHLLQRHRANQFEYSTEFQKIRTNIRAKRDHDELLSSIHNDI
eukprot:jgi/Hompol1/3680/HPOL_006685-RA